jgi:hypothetical protein
VRLVGGADEQGLAVDLAVDGHRGDAHLPQRPDDPDGDLAPVGDQHLGEHQGPAGGGGTKGWGVRAARRQAER